MTEISPLSIGAATESSKPAVTVPEDSRAPWGRRITSVQPEPTPLIAAVPDAAVRVGEAERMQHVAQVKADITGTGLLVDLTV